MNKVEYIKIGTTKLNNDTFNVYMNRSYGTYFLKHNNNSLMYPTIEEFIILSKRFKTNYNIVKNDNHKNIKYKECNTNINNDINIDIDINYRTFDSENQKYIKKIKHTKNNNIQKIKKVVLQPKVIIGSTLVSLVLIFSYVRFNNIIKSKYNILIDNKEYKDMTDYEILSNLNWDVELVEEDKILSFYSEIKKEEKNAHRKYFKNIDEFKEYKNINKPITFKDLRDAITRNKNIDEIFQLWLMEGIDNLEKSNMFNDFDFSVLYSNIERMTIQIVTDKINNNEITIGCFESNTSTVKILNGNLNKHTFLHESIGHGITEYYDIFKTDNLEEIYGFTMHIPIVEVTPNINKESEAKYTVDFNDSCYGLEEGKADWITNIACNENNENTVYMSEAEQLRIYMELCNLDFKTILDEGGTGILKALQNIVKENAFDYIEAVDVQCTFNQRRLEQCEDKYHFKTNIDNLITNYVKKRLIEGEKFSNIQNKLKNIFENKEMNVIYTAGYEKFELLDLNKFYDNIIEYTELFKYLEKTDNTVSKKIVGNLEK